MEWGTGGGHCSSHVFPRLIPPVFRGPEGDLLARPVVALPPLHLFPEPRESSEGGPGRTPLPRRAPLPQQRGYFAGEGAGGASGTDAPGGAAWPDRGRGRARGTVAVRLRTDGCLAGPAEGPVRILRAGRGARAAAEAG